MLQHRMACDDDVTTGDNHPKDLFAPFKKVLGHSFLLFRSKHGKSGQRRSQTAVYVRRQSPYAAPPRAQFFQFTIRKLDYAIRRVSANSME